MLVRSTHQPKIQLDDLIREVQSYEEEMCLVTPEGDKAVLITERQWRSIQETLLVYSVPGLVESILEAAREPLEDCEEYKFDEMEDQDDAPGEAGPEEVARQPAQAKSG